MKSRSQQPEMPSHLAGETVSDKGRALTEDERELFMGWHWISKPRWRRSREQRASFFAVTGSSTKGKDSWVVENVSDASAVMWPLIWCELVQEHWLEKEQEILFESLGEQLRSTQSDLDEFLAGDVNQTQYGMVAQVELIRNELAHDLEESCPPELNASLLDGLVDKWGVASSALEHAWAFSSDTLLQKMTQNLDLAIVQFPDRRTEWEEAKRSIESVAATIQELVDAQDVEAVTFQEASEALRDFFQLEVEAEVQDKRLLFTQNVAELSVLRINREQRSVEAQGELERLMADFPWASTNESLEEERRALSYMDPLITSAMFLEVTLENRLESLKTCYRLSTLPTPLGQDRFYPWLTSSHRARAEVIQEILSMVEVTTSSDHVQGVDLMFDTACRTSTDGAREAVVDLRPECELVTLSRAMITLFPTMSLRIVKDFVSLQNHLSALTLDPTQDRVEEMLELVKTFMRELTHGTDEDFYSAFAYQQDGRMFGDLFRASETAFRTIQESLRDHEKTYTDWIRTSVEYSVELKRMRRANVKELADKPEIPALADGCACEERWSAWAVVDGWPRRMSFDGCEATTSGSQLWGFSEDVSSWGGMCRVKTRLTMMTRCDYVGKVVACDPSATVSTASIRVWSDASRSFPVSLPLVSSKFFLGLGVQTDNPTFCSTDFARLQLLKTFQWKSYSWTPWYNNRQSCTEARIAPPGGRIDIMTCDRADDHARDWTVTLNVKWLSDQNVWGVYGYKAGDKFTNWFAGTWLAPMKDALSNPSWFFEAKDWEKSTIWKEFVLDQREIAKSGGAYWLALAAEVLSAFHVPLVGNALATGYDESVGVGANSKMLSYAWLVWNLLMKYEVIPQNWNIGIGRPAMAKWLNEITPKGVYFSPFRSKNNFYLTTQYNMITTEYVRPWLDLFPYMSKDQFYRLGEKTAQMGSNIAVSLEEFRSSSGNSIDVLENLDRSVLEHVASEWTRLYDADGTLLPRLVDRCPGEVKMYEIDADKYEGDDLNTLNLHWFHAKSLGSWLPTPLDLTSGPWYLTEHADGWLVEVRPAEEEPHMFPPEYKDIFTATEVIAPEQNSTQDLGAVWRHTLLSWVLASMDTEHVICVVEQLLPRGGRNILEGYVAQGCHEDAQAATSIWGPYFYCFSNEWKSSFFTDYWHSIVMSVEDMGSLALKGLNGVFHRGELKGIKMAADETGEQSDFNVAPSLDATLKFEFKVALNFMHIKGIAHAEPWLITNVVYNVASLIEAFRYRLVGPTSSNPEAKGSILSEHDQRIAACKACVQDPNMAFCDNIWVVNSMVSSTEDRSFLKEFNSDRCVPRTVENKDKCQSGMGDSTNREAGLLFSETMCPCFDKVSGSAITPDWYTSADACYDLKLEDDGESQRVANKVSDFENGFVALGEDFNLGNEMVHDPTDDGCTDEYTCCHAMISGVQHLRCVNKADLKSTGWFRDAVCKHFKPTDELAKNAQRKRAWYLIAKRPAWSGEDNWVCTGARTVSGSAFDGYWSLQDDEWTRDV